MSLQDEAPQELVVAVRKYFPDTEWDNALRVARLESNWNPFALNDSTDARHPCGSVIGSSGNVNISAERSVGYFQINSCNFPSWEWGRLYNADHNVGTAHMLWAERGWQPWYFSARTLGLL